MSKYAGADWIESAYKVQLSDFGKHVADLLGEWGFGIYHLEGPSLKKADWTSTYHISVAVNGDMATFDFGNLTRLVFLAHEYCIRVSVSPCNMRHLRLGFSPRKREGDSTERHPTIDEAIAKFKESK